MTSDELTDALEACSMERLRDLGHDLEERLGREIRARGKSELANLVAQAIDEAGAYGQELLEEYEVGRSSDAGGPTIIVVAAYLPYRPSVRQGDIILDPEEELLGSVPHRKVSATDARHLVETGRARWNRDLSQTEPPG